MVSTLFAAVGLFPSVDENAVQCFGCAAICSSSLFSSSVSRASCSRRPENRASEFSLLLGNGAREQKNKLFVKHFPPKPWPTSLPVWIASSTSFYQMHVGAVRLSLNRSGGLIRRLSHCARRGKHVPSLSGEAANISGGKHTPPERKIIPISSQRPISPYILFWYAIMGKMSSTVILAHSYTKITIAELTGWMTEIKKKPKKTRQQIINSRQTEISRSISEFWMFTCLFFIISFGSRWVLETLNEIFPF